LVGGEGRRAELAALCYDRDMIRTRDFFLFLICVAFLIVAIGFQVTQSRTAFLDMSQGMPQFRGGEGEPISAELVIVEDTRGARIARLREMVGAIATPPVSEIVVSEEVATSTTTAEQTTSSKAVLCPQYQTYARPWSTTGLTSVEREGVRIFHEGTQALADGELGVIRIILPVRQFASVNTSCIPSDVIGIALDGSLIRNNEQGLYGVFGENTHIGFALDGFPIYGASTAVTDSCGGTTVATEYHYYLSLDREFILGCFAAAPTLLP